MNQEQPEDLKEPIQKAADITKLIFGSAGIITICGIIYVVIEHL